MYPGMSVTVNATGIKAFIRTVLAGGILVLESIDTGQKMTVVENEVQPYKLAV